MDTTLFEKNYFLVQCLGGSAVRWRSLSVSAASNRRSVRAVFSPMALSLAKVLGGVALKQTIRCRIPILKYDDYLAMHFREANELLAHDPEEKSKPGDWVLVQELPEPLSIKVRHKLFKIVYDEGNMICPLTGKKTLGYEFLDDVDETTSMFGWKPLPERLADSAQPASGTKSEK